MFDLTLKNLVRFFSAVIPIIPQLLFTLNQYCSFRLPNPFVNLDESKPCLACLYVHFSCVSYKRILHVSLWWIGENPPRQSNHALNLYPSRNRHDALTTPMIQENRLRAIQFACIFANVKVSIERFSRSGVIDWSWFDNPRRSRFKI